MAHTPSEIPDTAMIMAAGFGTRMRPLTDDRPKPLVEVNGKPLIDYTLDYLAACGIRRVVVNAHYKAEMLADHLAGRTDLDIHISHEKEILESGGGVTNALPLLGDKPFFVMNSDVIWIDNSGEPILHRMARRYDENTMDGLLVVYPTVKAVGYDGLGDFMVGPAGEFRLRHEREVSPFVFTGIQLLHPRLFQGRTVKKFPLREFYLCPPEAEWVPRMRVVSGSGEWMHVGDPEGVRLAERIIRRFLMHNPVAVRRVA